MPARLEHEAKTDHVTLSIALKHHLADKRQIPLLKITAILIK
jgi:hypothetical protein